MGAPVTTEWFVTLTFEAALTEQQLNHLAERLGAVEVNTATGRNDVYVYVTTRRAIDALTGAGARLRLATAQLGFTPDVCHARVQTVESRTAEVLRSLMQGRPPGTTLGGTE